MRRLLVGLICTAALLWNAPASAQSRFVILMPGAGGAVPSDFLIRNKSSFDRAGLATAVATSPESAEALARSAHEKGHKVVIVAMSRGALYAATALASGAPAAAVVFVSGNYRGVAERLGSVDKLPPALVVHHRRDECRMTRPEGAERFIGWSAGRARIKWIDTSGEPQGGPCGPFGAHGFFRQDGPAVSAIMEFVRSR